MRKFLVAAVAASTLLLGAPAPASADPPKPVPSVLPPGWSFGAGSLTWTSEEVIPPGDARVEFWSGDRLLGHARPAADLRTFVLPGGARGRLTDLQVRIGGERVDAAAPTTRQRRAATAPATLPDLPATAVDPGVKGPYATTTGEYTLPGVKLSTYPSPVEMQAVVVAPKGAPGARPLAVFLHGRHWSCFAGDDLNSISLEWPCPAGSQPVPSHRGYLQAQELLASQGYVTVSISANGVNAQDLADTDGGAQARSSLVRMHLDRWAGWSGSGRAEAPAIVRAAPRADLSRVFLMGHSRGGEGVNRAAVDSLDPPAHDDYRGRVRWTIRGLLLIGPTLFGQNPQPDVPSATILPGCDGDVSDLQGQMFVDATRGVSSGRALHSALYMIGANHNFFNTEWTPGQAAGPAIDDFRREGDPLCTPGPGAVRLTAAQQQTAGATYIAAAARLFALGDDRARPLLDGTGVRAPSAGPVRVLSHAIGANRTAAVVPDETLGVRNARLCDQVPAAAEDSCISPDDPVMRSPHFVSLTVPEPGRKVVALDGGVTAALTPAKALPVAGSRALAMRLIVPPNAPATGFAVTVIDDRGRRADLGTATVAGLPGSDWTRSHWAQEVRLPLPAGVRSVARLEITPRGDGPAWLIDAWGWRPGTPAPRPADLNRIDVGEITVDEGDSGTDSYTVRVTSKGPRTATVRLSVVDGRTYRATSWVAEVKPGTSVIPVPVSVPGNTTYGGDRRWTVVAKAIRGVVVGDYDGGVVVREDEPAPEATITPSATAAEGSPLTWTITLSAAVDDFTYLIFLPQSPASGPELSSTDLDPQWFTENSGEDPEPSRPLSGSGLQPFVEVPTGTTSVQLSMPTVADGQAEGAEHTRLEGLLFLPGAWDPVLLPPVDGAVTD
ncbi:hypothetical protein [Actinoplanes philippinensis]|uniref:hypothetical protein n=1 Tax=Actinoplanes philippinensis TaxID=35752 RepID=UPI0033F60B60